MISRLKVKVEATLQGVAFTHEVTLDALQLLGLLQQAQPGLKPLASLGTLASPWEPKTPAEWFYCAKIAAIAQRQLLKLTQSLDSESGTLKARATTAFVGVGEARKAWLKVGGRRIRLTAANLYSSDCGLATVALPRGTEPGLVYENSSYPVILGKLKTWMNGSPKDLALTTAMRNVLQGKAWNGSPDILPVLTTVLFVSEVARNHTALHAALMMLDLIKASTEQASPLAALPTGNVSWQKALWINENDVTCPTCDGDTELEVICDRCTNGLYDMGECRTCNGTGCARKKGYRNPSCHGGRHSVSCNSCRGTARVTVRCWHCEQSGVVRQSERDVPLGRSGDRFKGGVAQLQGGLLPMSHTGSAQGGAYDLAGGGNYYGVFKNGRGRRDAFEPLHVLTIARRKEATIAATWLAIMLGKGLVQKQLSRSELIQLKVTATPLTADLVAKATDGTKVYEQLEALPDEGVLDFKAWFDDWMDKWLATNRDLRTLSRGPQVSLRDPEGGAKLAVGIQKAHGELGTYRQELAEEFTGKASALVNFALLSLFQKRVESFDVL